MSVANRRLNSVWLVAITAVAGLLLFVALSISFDAAAGSNVIRNGDFESGTAEWSYTNVTFSTGAPAQSGSAAHITNDTGDRLGQIFQSDLALQPHTEYQLSFWVRSATGSDLFVILQGSDDSSSKYGLFQEFTTNEAWQQIVVNFTTEGFDQPVADGRLRFRLNKGLTQEVNIDDVVLMAVGAPPEPPTETPTEEPPAPTPTDEPATETPEPPTATATSEPPTATTEPPTATATSEPPTATATSEPPTATATATEIAPSATPSPTTNPGPTTGENALRNGDFENGTAEWFAVSASYSVGPPAVDGSAAQIANENETNLGQLIQDGIALAPNTEYTLSFWARNDGTENVRIILQQGANNSANYGLNEVIELTEDWQFFGLTFTTQGFSSDVTDGRLRVRLGSGATRNASLDNMVLSPGSGGPPPPPPLPTNTATPAPPTATPTSLPPTATATSQATPTATATGEAPTPTATSVPPTPTATNVPPTSTPDGGSGTGDNTVVNGDFESGISGWSAVKANLGIGSPGQPGAAAHLSNANGSDMGQLRQDDLTLAPDTEYELRFWARSTTADDIRVILGEQNSPFTNYGLSQDFSLGDSWQEHVFRFTTNRFDTVVNDGRLRFRLGRGSDESVSIDNVILRPASGAPPPPPPTSTATPAGTPTPTTVAPTATATSVTPPTATPTATATPLSPTATPTPDPGSGGSNTLRNGDFESGTANWSTKLANLGVGSPGHTGAAAHFANINATDMGDVRQDSLTLSPFVEYELSFWARSDSSAELRVILGQQDSPFTNYGLSQTFALTGQWQRYSTRFITDRFSSVVHDGRLRFRLGVGADQSASLDDVMLAPADGSPPPPPPPGSTPTPVPTPGPANRNDELLFFDWNKEVVKSDKGFPQDRPPLPSGNIDWTKPRNFAEGTIYMRAEIVRMPKYHDMMLEFCFWQYKTTLESCTTRAKFTGSPGKVVEWSREVARMWKKNGNPIDWENPRDWNGFVIRNGSGKPVSSHLGWNWNGENPDEWYPAFIRFTAVVVEKGGHFDGWDYYINP